MYSAGRDTVELTPCRIYPLPPSTGIFCVSWMGAAHAERVPAADLTRTAIPVVRGVIPGFEVSCRNKERIRPTG